MAADDGLVGLEKQQSGVPELSGTSGHQILVPGLRSGSDTSFPSENSNGMLHLTDAQEEHLHNCFNEFDKDGSGRLDVKELRNLMQVLGMNPRKRDVRKLMEEYDADESRSLDYEEFRSWIIPVVNREVREMRRGFEEAFREFDKDNSGKLDKDEFRDAVCNKGKNKLTDEQFEDLFQAVDCDDDGKINCNEMINLFCATLEAWMDQQDEQEGRGSQQHD